MWIIISLFVGAVALYFSEYLQFEISNALASMIVSLFVSFIVIVSVL